MVVESWYGILIGNHCSRTSVMPAPVISDFLSSPCPLMAPEGNLSMLWMIPVLFCLFCIPHQYFYIIFIDNSLHKFDVGMHEVGEALDYSIGIVMVE